ncbi:response regulator transcription factor [Ramlibacter sp. 2FC]|uniref:response regulator n=1 Tax=Ramlibacter sp. 2FC TaxID=2502188 RepID=UPI0010F88767|nr:response regulator transcription factor [Ramlibacter sp. 2FC]
MTDLWSSTRFSSRESVPSLWPEHFAGQPGKPAQVLLVDDDPHMRMVISQELLVDPRILLVAQAASVHEGRRMIDRHEFDVLMVDLNLGDGWGFELIEHMKSARPDAEAVVISALEDEQHALRAFELGATGYLVKNSWFGNFPQAVLQVVNGGASITPSMARRLLRKLEHGPSVQLPEPGAEEAEPLSEREKEILKIVAVGYTSAEIGERLNISCMTVNTHIKNIYRKLHVRTRAQAVNFAAHHGLL